MIDTVILQIPFLDYHILDHEMFHPATYNLATTKTYNVKHVNNPTSQDKKNGIYRPRLTIVKRPPNKIPLKVEFSIPKMIFGNNLQEVNNGHLPTLLNKLQQNLKEMGVMVSYENLAKAPVSTVHYSKNISLSDGWTSTAVIKELAKINLSKKLDITKMTFRNEGNSLQYYSKSHSFVVYDKLQDLKQGKSRAIDKDQNYIQKTLFDTIRTESPKTEILRLEARLCNKRKLKSTVKKLGYETDNPTLSSVFNSKLSQAVLNDYWQNFVVEPNLFLFISSKDSHQILHMLIDNEIKPKQAIYLTGLFILSKEKGIRELRQIVTKNSSDRTWYRISNDIKVLNQLAPKVQIHGYIQTINDQLTNFKSYKLNLQT